MYPVRMADMKKSTCVTAWGQRLGTVDVGAFGSPQLSSSPQTPNLMEPSQPPMLPPPHSQKKAVTVGPFAGNFLWSAGNNLTWGLDSPEKRASAHPQTAPLPLWFSPPIEDKTSATARGGASFECHMTQQLKLEMCWKSR